MNASRAIARVGRYLRWYMWAMPIVRAEMDRPKATLRSLVEVCISVGVEPHIGLREKLDREIGKDSP